MRHLACVNLRAFPLQQLLVQNPGWQWLPTVVVASDTPQAVVLWANDRARRAHINPGMRYATALGLTPNINAGVVSSEEIDFGIAAIARVLRDYSPHIEPSHDIPGVFWLDASGFERMSTSYYAWGQKVHANLKALGYHPTIVIGFSHFGTYAISTIRRGVSVFEEPSQEYTAVRQVPLSELHASPRALETLDLLGVENIGGLLALPAAGLRNRLGDEAYLLHRQASGAIWTPLQSEYDAPPLQMQQHLDYPESSSIRLLALMARMLSPLLETLKRRGDLLANLQWRMVLDRSMGTHRDHVKPAAPTLNSRQLLDLVGLRLERNPVSTGVVGLTVIVHNVPAITGQTTLFQSATSRNLAAANRAIAKLRTLYGENAVVTASIQPEHLPENRSRWEPVHRVQLPKPIRATAPTLMRHIFAQPMPLSDSNRQTVRQRCGPYTVSGNWWMEPVHREYYFEHTSDGQILWTYFDLIGKKWFVHGQVE